MTVHGAALGLAGLNAALPADAEAAFARCCGARRWAEAMAAARPFRDEADLHARAAAAFDALGRDDWLEAFRAHPRIGDRDALRAKFADTRAWAEGEQAGALGAADNVVDALADGNRAYEARFGHIFIVCASGLGAAEMLARLRARLDNAPDAELEIAAEEQRRIARLRLDKLLEAAAPATNGEARNT
ncbi:MAG TPA: 2-oxo-4-hydroxy-4-carboxy-5-ureidoimidazoline decarboxylase [Myxococcota bacterium]|jgi:2-oxo-4-hydroxy-4-carboxy-5-ureidoimidazoline decarboxylase|nr:2-oxo-4-hydroxy-4-carboxy-5-ureidoimidazoline decarboxylase [Myxococcota bacterium]